MHTNSFDNFLAFPLKLYHYVNYYDCCDYRMYGTWKALANELPRFYADHVDSKCSTIHQDLSLYLQLEQVFLFTTSIGFPQVSSDLRHHDPPPAPGEDPPGGIHAKLGGSDRG